MSQAGIISMSGGGGGSPVETLTGDTGGPVPPTGNNINVIGGYSSVNNVNGIMVAGNAGTSTETITLTNRYQTSQTFSDNASHQIFTFNMGATPGMYLFNFSLVAFNFTSSLGANYSISVPLRTDGALGHSLIPQDIYEVEEGAMTGTIVTSGLQPATNTFFVSVQGYGGNKINWGLTGTYIFQGNI